MKRKIILPAILLLAAFLPLNAQPAVTVRKQTDEAGLRRQSFDKVWNTINEKHYDKTFGGVDWQKMREIYEPKAMAAKTTNEFHAVLRQMLGELKLSHFGVYSRPSQLEEIKATNGIIGVQIKMIDRQAVISRVEKDSTAEKAGLKTGFVIEKIDGKRVAEILAPLEKNLSERAPNEKVKLIYREKFIMSFIDGKLETAVKIEILDGKNQTQTFEIKRYRVQNEMSEAIGNFPPQEVIFESKLLDGNIGYISFNMWVIPQMPKIRAAIREFAAS